MASAREYCEMMSTEQLRGLLREEYYGRGNLPSQMILEICDILSQREPDRPGAVQVLRQLCQQYLD